MCDIDDKLLGRPYNNRNFYWEFYPYTKSRVCIRKNNNEKRASTKCGELLIKHRNLLHQYFVKHNYDSS